MALQCEGHPILSTGEWKKLCEHMRDGEGSPTLSAWALGEQLTPAQLMAAFDVDARLAAADREAQALIDTATSRMERAFPALAIR